tara:strand:+ start:206 stop:589 length:384 start_codon:yes stop_codon:yes gene_type:complete
MPKYKRTFKSGKKKKKRNIYKPKNLTKMFSKLKFRKPRKHQKQRPKRSKYKKPIITLRQRPKRRLNLRVSPQPHYQSFSYSDAQSSSYMTGQKPRFKRKAQKEIDIDGYKQGQLLMQKNDEGIIIDY